MREILFRGKMKTDNGEYKKGCWVYGDLVTLMDGKEKHPHIYGKGEVKSETIGQYTGLTDKNGKKIFEGDIVTQPVRETRKHSPCIIEFKDGKFQAHYISEKKFFDRYYDLNSYTKIIGNIHDNPELLKGVEV